MRIIHVLRILPIIHIVLDICKVVFDYSYDFWKYLFEGWLLSRLIDHTSLAERTQLDEVDFMIPLAVAVDGRGPRP